MTTQTADSIIASFPNEKISSSDEEPTYNLIKIGEKELIENVTSIRSELGGGQHGYLGLMMSTVKYHTITGFYFTPHANPGSVPVFPDAPTQPQIAQINATHKSELKLWREQELVKRAIKKQLTNMFHPRYIADLHDNYTGYNNVSILEILQHLYDNYGDLDESDLEANEKTLTQEFDVTEPFSMFIRRIEDCMDLAEAAGAPYTDRQIATKAFNSIIKADLLHDGVKDWRRKASTDKTWANLKLHFTVEVKEYKKNNKTTSKTAGYQVANTANQALIDAQNDFKDFTSQIIEEFKTSNQENEPPQMTQQAAYTSSYSNEVKEMKEQMKLLLEQNKLLVQKLSTADTEPSHPTRKTKAQKEQERKEYQKKPFLYCYTCGYQKDHNSSDCAVPWKAANHKKKATIADNQGGNQRGAYPYKRSLRA